MSRLDTVEAGAPQSSSFLEQALENASSDSDLDGFGLNNEREHHTPAIDAPHHFNGGGGEFEFDDDEDAFFKDLPPINSDR